MLGGSGARCTHRPRTSVDLDAHRRSARVSGREAAEAPRDLDLVDFFGERPRWWHASLRSRLRRFSFPNRLGADRRQTDDIVSRRDGADSGPVADKTENGPTHASATLSVADLPSDRTAGRVSLIRGVCVWQAATAGDHAQPFGKLVVMCPGFLVPPIAIGGNVLLRGIGFSSHPARLAESRC